MMMLTAAILSAFMISPSISAATPPETIAYQGVLNDAGGEPETGDFDMVFRFYSQVTGGTLLLTDTHNAAAPSGQVAVTDGLFSTQLGAGTVTPGTESDLTEVFRDNAGVWLEVEVATEILSPRVQMDSTAFAFNATTLDGQAASAFAAANHVQTVATGGTGLTSPGANGNVLASNGTEWVSSPVAYTEADGVIGNEVTNAANATLTRSGSGTEAGPYTLGLNLANANTWTAQQTFSSAQVTGAMKDASGDAGTSGQLLQSTATGTNWVDATAFDGDGIIGNEVTNVTNSTLTRSGSGTGASPYTLGLNLANANTWTGSQTFSADTTFPGNGKWRSSGYVGIGTTTPEGALHVVSEAFDGIDQQFSSGTWAGSFLSEFWQSFTAGLTGELTQITIRSATANFSTVALYLYEGEGVGGTLLKTVTGIMWGNFNTWTSILFTPHVTVNEGSVYTFRWVKTGGSDPACFHDASGGYSGGRSSLSASDDIHFRTYMYNQEAILFEGNVGIGTMSPAYPLDVAGDARITGALRDSSGDAGTNGQLLQSTATGTDWASASAFEGDGVIGNEVTDAANATLTRSGSGTGAAPYALALNLANANTWTAQQTFSSAHVTGEMKDASGDAGTSGQLLQSTGTGTNWVSASTFEGDGVIGNEVINATNATLTRSGSGTGASPYTLGLNLANANTWTAQQTFSSTQVTGVMKDTSGDVGTSGQLLQSTGTGTNWVDAAVEGDAVIGNEVTNVTNATLTRSGSGTGASPYTLGLNLANANTWTAQQTFASAQVTGVMKDTSGDSGTSGQLLQSTGTGTNWVSASTFEGDGVIGNEVINATNATLTRNGLGTGASPYTLGLNLANANTWTAQQTFSSAQVTGALKDTSGDAGTSGQLLQSTATGTNWVDASAFEGDGVIGNEVTNVTNATLTRSGSGTVASPHTVGLNLSNANDWSGIQTFSTTTNFPGNGIWTATGKVGIGITNPLYTLHVNGTMAVDNLPQGDRRNVQWDIDTHQFYQAVSSRRYKENITPLEDDFRQLLSAEPMTYTMIGAPERWEIGYIAEDIDELGLTHLVHYTKDGRPDALKYEKMILYLVEIAKDQRTQIEEQQEELEDQRTRLEAQQVRDDDLQARIEELTVRLTRLEQTP